MHILKTLIVRSILALGIFSCAGQLLANPVYHVSIDTSALAGQSGYLDFLFLGLANAAPAQASVTSLSGDFDVPNFVSGDASGSVGTGISLGNGTGWNEFGQWVHFGHSFRFDVQFDVGAAQGAGTDLGIALLDEQYGFLGASGNVVTFSLQPGADDQVSFDRSIADVNTNDVPEPGSLAQMAAGFLLLAGTLRRKAR